MFQSIVRGAQQRFVPPFQRALPHLGREGPFWRMRFLLGAMCNLLADPARLLAFSGGLCDPNDTDVSLSQLLAFLVPAMQAPPAEVRTRLPEP